MRYLILIAMFGLSGCAGSLPGPKSTSPDETPLVEPSVVMSDSEAAVKQTIRPWARPDDLVIATAPTETTELPPPPKPDVPRDSFGTTVASLGDPTEPGIWIKTPLVKTRQQGKIKAANGKEVVGTLIPLDGPETAGSQLSLQAMQALGLPLTDLPEVAVSPL